MTVASCMATSRAEKGAAEGQAAITNGAIHDPPATRIPNTVGDSAPPICPLMFIIPDTVPEYSPPMSIGTAQDGPMIEEKQRRPSRRRRPTLFSSVSFFRRVALYHRVRARAATSV